MFVRLFCALAIVLSSITAWSATLQDNGDGTVTDLEAGLTWQQVDDGTPRNWKDARRYCEELSLAGKTGWRLPTPTELASIVVYQATNPTIDLALFPSTRSSGYWSGTEMVGNNWQAWYVDFRHGPVDFSRKSNSHYVRCAR